MEYLNLVKKFIPSGSEILNINSKSNKGPAIIIKDIDGDMGSEIIAAYKYKGENYILILKKYLGHWYILTNLKGTGYNITYLDAYPITNNKINNLIVGWQQGAIWSVLNIFNLTSSGFKNIVPQNIYYSKIELLKPSNKKEGKYEIALWLHDTGEAYNIKIYKWINDKFATVSPYMYPEYFKTVSKYYEEKVQEYPNAAFYLYYLADAEMKAGMPEKALKAINKAILLSSAYPSYIEELLKFKKFILSKTNMRNIKFYPASVKTEEGTYYGYIDDNGEFIIKPQYDSAEDFQKNGLAIVGKYNKLGIIDGCGKFLVEPKYESIAAFSEGLSVVLDDDGFKVMDEAGNILTIKAYSYISEYKEGRTVASYSCSDGKSLYGYLDMEGKEIIPLNYEYASDFNGGKALVKLEKNNFALIDIDGNILQHFNYLLVEGPNDGLLSFKANMDSLFGYMDEEANIMIQPKFYQAMPFAEERAVINMSKDYTNKFGLIDKAGEYILEPQYNEINLLGEKRYAIGKAINEKSPYLGSKYAVANENGKLLTDFIYFSISQYNNGLASASDNQNTFFIDKDGKIVDNLPVISGTGTMELQGNIIKAFIDQRLSYLSKAGKEIYSQNKIIPLDDKYKVIEQKYKPNKDYLVYYPQVLEIVNTQAQSSVNSKLAALSLVKPIENKQLDYNYYGDFSVEFFKKNLLVLEISGYQYYFGAAHGIPIKAYPNINLINGNFYVLKDLFKQDCNYIMILSEIIGNQIKNNKEYSYVFPDSFKGIKPNQTFYVDENNLYIYFEPYEIAPYAAGFPTFKIPFDGIMNIIDTTGEFWRAFH